MYLRKKEKEEKMVKEFLCNINGKIPEFQSCQKIVKEIIPTGTCSKYDPFENSDEE